MPKSSLPSWPSEGEEAGQNDWETAREAETNKEEAAAAAALSALRLLYGEEARPRSEAQLSLCVAAIRREKNIIAVLPTGSGKSAAWLVPALCDPGCMTLVVVPFKALLDQHLADAQGRGIRAEKWTAKLYNKFPEEVNLLFAACESIGSPAFKS